MSVTPPDSAARNTPTGRRYSWAAAERRLLVLLGDLTIVIGSLLISESTVEPTPSPLTKLLWIVVLTLVWLGVTSALNAYDLTTAARPGTALPLVTLASGLTLGIYALIPHITPPLPTSRAQIALRVLLLLGPLLTWRIVCARLLTRPAFRVRAVVLGRGRTTGTLAALLGHPDRHDYELIATIDYRAAQRGDPRFGEQLRALVTEREIQEIAIDGGAFRAADLGPVLVELAERGVRIRTDWEMYESLTGRVLLPLADPAGLGSRGSVAALYTLGWRLCETVFALLGLLALAPLLGLAALAVAVDSRGGPLYWQERVGRFGSTFRLVKLRTMVIYAEADGQPVWAYQGDPRITRVGALLRRIRLDEAPQLWNVLRGEMSLVGPRPERPEFVKFLSDRIPLYRARHLVRPGITGWAQVHLRYGASVHDAALKLQYDLYYIRHRTLLLDLTILLRTITVVLRLQGT